MPVNQTVEIVERCAYRAWPAAEVRECGGWRLRHTSGVTHRANSVWPNDEHGEISLDDKIAAAEAFYQSRERPAIFQLCEAAKPAHLDRALEARGYTRGRATTVLTAIAAQVLIRTEPGDYSVQVNDECNDAWLAVYRAAEEVPEDSALHRQAIMRRISTDAAYAICRRAGTPCAVGSIVCDGTWAGLFNMATSAPFRRQGAAQAVMSVLVPWAIEKGAEKLYLQVMNDNLPAWTLYSRLSFSRLYEYHYRWRAP